MPSYLKIEPALFYVARRYRAGIIDEKGKVVLPCYFQSVQPEIRIINPTAMPELFPVKDKNKWGYAQKGGKIIIPFQFKEASHFSENMAIVKKEKSYFLINKKGELITKNGYDKVMSVDSDADLAIIVNKQGKHGAVNSKGEEKIPLI